MPKKINGQIYYRTAEVYRTIGIGKNTLYRWLQNGILGEGDRRDRRGWRLFTQDDLDKLKMENDQVRIVKHSR